MSEVADFLPGNTDSGLLLIADHASSHVPSDVDLGVDPALLNQHVALDIGVDTLSRDIAARLDCAAIIAGVSRLVVDLNRLAVESHAIPIASDGYTIPGNAALGPEGRMARIERFWEPYHALIEARIEDLRPAMLISLHSFTPALVTRPQEERPWHIGILYNEDDRAARVAIEALQARGIPTGDNLPYSGKILNTTMNMHAEARGLPYLGIEVRQDLISDDIGIAHWASILAPVIAEVRDAL
ncbi:MAG: N-formylglutamate amidohydrolase [Sphingosinicella sp.]|nr:N-formylglutamate amidohydrolase [Sphingosinicella sp.]